MHKPQVIAGMGVSIGRSLDGVPRSRCQNDHTVQMGDFGGPEQARICAGSHFWSGVGVWPQPSSMSSTLGHWLHPGLLGSLGEVCWCHCMDRARGGVEPVSTEA